jgi:DNA-binding response OmpR family regulator
VTAEKTRLLIIDDDEQLLDLLEIYLRNRGYAVTTASGGHKGLRRFYQDRPDLVILDVMMPRMTGWHICERIRDMSDAPIIVLTALGKEDDCVRGLRLGADDYVVKPFGLRELAARVETVLRRAAPGEKPKDSEVLYADDYLVIDAGQAEITCGEERVRLTAIELQLLLFLVRNRGRLLTPRQILTNVWGLENMENENYVRLYIWRLRQKIEPDPEEPRYILTAHGLGYRFVGIQ